MDDGNVDDVAENDADVDSDDVLGVGLVCILGLLKWFHLHPIDALLGRLIKSNVRMDAFI